MALENDNDTSASVSAGAFGPLAFRYGAVIIDTV